MIMVKALLSALLHNIVVQWNRIAFLILALCANMVSFASAPCTNEAIADRLDAIDVETELVEIATEA